MNDRVVVRVPNAFDMETITVEIPSVVGIPEIVPNVGWRTKLAGRDPETIVNWGWDPSNRGVIVTWLSAGNL